MLKKIYSKKDFWPEIFAVMIYFCINLWAHFLYVPLKCFYMDDISLLAQFQNENLLSYLLHGHDNKFRPVSDFFLYMGYKVFNIDTKKAYIYILLIGAITCGIVCYLSIKITDSIWMGIYVSICLSISRFAYYAVGQYFGIMENISMLTAIFTLYYGICFVISDEKNEKKKYIFMNTFALLCIFSHERYIMLYGFLIGVIFIKYFLKKSGWKYYMGILASAGIMWIFRIIYLGNGAFQGTAGTNLIEELNVIRIVSYFFEGILLILGWNAGEAYLNGINLSRVKGIYNFIPFIMLLLAVVLTTIIVRYALKNKEYIIFKVIATMICFVGVALMSGCVTIRLETRWVYTPYIGFVMLICYMISHISMENILFKHYKAIISGMLLFCTITLECYFRPYWQENYLGAEYDKYNSIYDIVVEGGYGDEIYSRPLIILENIDNGVQVINCNVMDCILLAYCKKGTVDWFYINNFSELNNELIEKNPIIIYVEWQKNPNIWIKEIFDITNIYNSGRWRDI